MGPAKARSLSCKLLKPFRGAVACRTHNHSPTELVRDRHPGAISWSADGPLASVEIEDTLVKVLASHVHDRGVEVAVVDVQRGLDRLDLMPGINRKFSALLGRPRAVALGEAAEPDEHTPAVQRPHRVLGRLPGDPILRLALVSLARKEKDVLRTGKTYASAADTNSR